MTTAALLRLAWRESRTTRRRLALYMSSIAFGVAALVAIDSFAGNVTRSVRDQSRTLVGGDLAIKANAAFPAVVDSLLDSLGTRGIAHARVTTFASMALAPGSGFTRLAQVRAVSEGYPFYGTIETTPAAAWSAMHRDHIVVVDPSLLLALNVSVGDSLRLGTQSFRIAGTLGTVSGDAGIASVIGPRVYVSDRWIPETGLLRFGSRAQYDAVLRVPAALATPRESARLARTLRRRIDPRAAAQQEAAEAQRARGARDAPPDEVRGAAPTEGTDTLAATADTVPGRAPTARVRIRTVADTERDFTQAVARLADFLSILGLIALLLGGIGVASGIHAFVASKIDTVAVLRCLGATSRQVLALYVVQAAMMGLVGAASGVMLGIGIQFVLPHVVADFLPLNVALALEPFPVLLGLATGVWVALVFALRPLLALRRVSPLQAIRRDLDAEAMPREWRDPARLGVDALLVISLVALIVVRLGGWRLGLGVSAGIVAVVGLLYGAATVLMALARRAPRASWPFPLRQGIANLHRPANQTRAVTLSLGFGAFLLSTVYLVQANLLHRLDATADVSAGNLLFFDVQDDQAAPLDSLIHAKGYQIVQRTPIVTMRLAAVNGRSVAALLADTTVRRAGWAMRREYRSTYRDGLQSSETLVGGRWFPDSASRAVARRAAPDAPFEVSFEKDVASDLGVAIGDTVTWNVQGVPVHTVVTSLRSVNWARFEANFFVVFTPEAIRRAPQQFAMVAAVPTAAGVATVQRDVVRRFPNISSLDLSLVQQTVGAIVNRVVLAIRFLGLFALAMGIPVMFSAVAATRRARVREGVLLRTLGASRAQVVRVLLAEYGALGALGAVSGMVLAFLGAWALTVTVFHDTFSPAIGATLGIAAGMLGLTMLIGWLTSRDAYQATPMAAIRDN